MSAAIIRILEYMDLEGDPPVYLVSRESLNHRNIESLLGYNPRTLQFEIATNETWPEIGV